MNAGIVSLSEKHFKEQRRHSPVDDTIYSGAFLGFNRINGVKESILTDKFAIIFGRNATGYQRN